MVSAEFLAAIATSSICQITVASTRSTKPWFHIDQSNRKKGLI
jgi:hypothetical protein